MKPSSCKATLKWMFLVFFALEQCGEGTTQGEKEEGARSEEQGAMGKEEGAGIN